MTKPSFRLQTVLDLRERSKKSSEDAFLLAQQAVHKEQKQLDSLEIDLVKSLNFREEKRSEYIVKATAPQTIASIRLQENHIKSLKEKEEAIKRSIEQQKTILQKTQSQAQMRRDEMITASRDYKTIDKLKVKFVDAHRKFIETQEDNARDELTQARFATSTEP